MATNPDRMLDWVTDFDLTEVVKALLAFARSEEEKAGLLFRLRDIAEFGVRSIEALAQPHMELTRQAMESYERSREAYRSATKYRRLFSFGLRAEELERESHERALQEASELVETLSLPSLPEAARILRENRVMLEELRRALLEQLHVSRERDILDGLLGRVFRYVFSEG